MKKLLLLFALLLIVTATAAHADTVTDLLESFGMTNAEAEAFTALVAGTRGKVTEQDIRDLLPLLPEGDSGKPLAGTLKDGVYTDSAGYSFHVPEGWTLQENQIGPAVILSGPVTERGLMPTISMMVVTETKDSLMQRTKEEIDAVLGAALQNYMTITLDDFEFQGNQARELVCMYGADEVSMLMQYQLQFVSGGMIYMVTLTTLAEEAAHEAALDTYDAFLAQFELESPGDMPAADGPDGQDDGING